MFQLAKNLCQSRVLHVALEMRAWQGAVELNLNSRYAVAKLLASQSH